MLNFILLITIIPSKTLLPIMPACLRMQCGLYNRSIWLKAWKAARAFSLRYLDQKSRLESQEVSDRSQIKLWNQQDHSKFLVTSTQACTVCLI